MNQTSTRTDVRKFLWGMLAGVLVTSLLMLSTGVGTDYQGKFVPSNRVTPYIPIDTDYEGPTLRP